MDRYIVILKFKINIVDIFVSWIYLSIYILQ